MCPLTTTTPLPHHAHTRRITLPPPLSLQASHEMSHRWIPQAAHARSYHHLCVAIASMSIARLRPSTAPCLLNYHCIIALASTPISLPPHPFLLLTSSRSVLCAEPEAAGCMLPLFLASASNSAPPPEQPCSLDHAVKVETQTPAAGSSIVTCCVRAESFAPSLSLFFYC